MCNFLGIKAQGIFLKEPLEEAAYVFTTPTIPFVWESNLENVILDIDVSPLFISSNSYPIIGGGYNLDISLMTIDTYYWRIRTSNDTSTTRSFTILDLDLIGSLVYHANAQTGVSHNNGLIYEWENQANSSFLAEQNNSFFQPKIEENIVNNHSAILFGGDNGSTPTNFSLNDFAITDTNFTFISSYKQISLNSVLSYLLGSSNPRGTVFSGGTNGGGRNFGILDATDVYRSLGTTDLDWGIRSACYDKLFLNSNLISTTVGNPVNGFYFNTIGVRPDNLSLNFHGYLGDILIYNEILPDSSRLLVENYLKTKYTPYPDLGQDTLVCGPSINIGFRTDHGYSSIQWSTGETGVDSITAIQNGWHWVEVESFGITLRDSIYIDGIVPVPQIDLNQNTVICYGDSIQVNYTPMVGFVPTWSTGETTNSIWIKDASEFVFITHEDVNSCAATSDSYLVRVDSLILKSTLGPDKNICDGANLFVSTTSQDGPFGYEWSTGDTTATTSISTLGVQDVDLILTDINGCIFYDTITINALNIPAPNVVFDYDTACPLLPTQFFDNATSGGLDNITSWSWSFYQEDSAYIQNPSYAFEQGSYTVSLTVETDSGCINTGFQNIITHKTPVARYVEPIVCASTPTFFESNSFSPIPDFVNQWQWTIDGQYYYGEEIEANISNEGNNEILLVVTTDKGCTDTLLDTIEVFPALIPDFSTNKLCLGDTVFFLNETLNLSSINYLWTFDHNNDFSTEENPSYFYPTTEESYDVSLFVENAIGCKNETTKTVSIFNPPIANWHTDTFCIEIEGDISDASISPFDTIVAWTWIIDADTFNTENIQYLFEDTMLHDITLSVLTNNGCKDDTTGTISAHSSPNVDFTFAPTYGTAPIDISFDNQTINAVDFDWDFGDNQGTSSQENPSYSYTENGIYNITLQATNQYGCVSQKTQNISLIPSELDIELTNISLQKNNNTDGSISLLTSVQLNNVGSRLITNTDLNIQINKETLFSEYWTGNIEIGGADIYTFNAEALIYSPETTEYICVEAINTNDGSELNLSNNKVCTIINDGVLKISNPYPNPTSSDVFIDLIFENQGEVDIDVVEISGKRVKMIQNLNVVKGYNKIAISTDNMATGDYILMISYLDEEYKKRFTIVNK